MAQVKTAKLFRNGASQAIRLPAEFRFEGTEVFIARDERTGDVILSSRPPAGDWGEFFHFLRATEDAPAFMADRPMNQLPAERDLFADPVADLVSEDVS
jgi:antitoxin VapB